MWLFDYLAIRQERDGLKRECKILEGKIDGAQHQLHCEIDRNREREDHLLNVALRKAGLPTPFRHKDTQRSATDPIDVVFDDKVEHPDIQEAEERALWARAKEFHAQAKANGYDYDLEVLIEMMRKHPEEYLDN